MFLTVLCPTPHSLSFERIGSEKGRRPSKKNLDLSILYNEAVAQS